MTIADDFAKQLPEVDSVSTLPPHNEIPVIAKGYQKQLRARELEYDRVTTDGLTQSLGPSHGFPGGEDTRFAGCS